MCEGVDECVERVRVVPVCAAVYVSNLTHFVLELLLRRQHSLLERLGEIARVLHVLAELLLERLLSLMLK